MTFVTGEFDWLVLFVCALYPREFCHRIWRFCIVGHLRSSADLFSPFINCQGYLLIYGLFNEAVSRLNDVVRSKWGDYPWRCLGDWEKQRRSLIKTVSYFPKMRQEFYRLSQAMFSIAVTIVLLKCLFIICKIYVINHTSNIRGVRRHSISSDRSCP